MTLLRKKISDYLWLWHTRFLEKYIGKIPTPEAWQGQWYAYNRIKNNYLNTTYDIGSIFPKNAKVLDQKNLWVYWNSGIENAPDIVKKCFLQLQKNKPNDYHIYLLTQENIKDYVELPSFIQNKLTNGSISQTHFSDILRTALIYQYGGIWIDATCLLTDKIPEKILNSNFFVFQASLLNLRETYSPIKCSSWFIASNERHNPILERTLQILLSYWKKNNRIIHYYLYHLIMAAIVNNNAECAQIWQEMPYICNMNPHVLQYSFEKNYNEIQWKNILESCFVHKLTYKFNNDVLCKADETILQHFMRLY